MPKADPIKLVFAFERDTKTKRRFTEMQRVDGTKNPDPMPKEKAIIEKLYMSKAALKKMGDPDVLHVTIEAP